METISKEIKLIAVYGRVSTSAQEVQETIEAQLLQVHKFAQEHGYTIVKEYLDEGWSGDILARPKLDELRLDAKKHLWEAVLIYDPDRLGRRYFYQELVMDELKQLGIETLFVTVPPVKDLNDRMMGGMRGLFAEYEREKISERFRMGKVNRVNNGNILLSEAPYGYTYVPNMGKKGSLDYKVGHLEINKKEAEIVRIIFNWVVEDSLTLRSVVRKLQEKNILPRKSKRGVWNTSTLSTLLRNQTYIGNARWGASYAVVPEKPLKNEKYKKIKKTSRRMTTEDKWSYMKVPRILENDEIFFKAGKNLKSNYEMSSRNTKNEYLLGGKMWCTCGIKRSGQGSLHGKHLYYRCANRTYNFPLPATCTERGINARIADNLIWEEVKKIMSSPVLMVQQIDRWNKKNFSKVNFSANDSEILKNEILKLKRQEDRLNKAYGAGLFDMGKLQEYLIPIKEKVSTIELQIRDIKQQENEESKNKVVYPSIEAIKEFAIEASKLHGDLNFVTKQSIIRSTVDKVVGNQQELKVTGTIFTSNSFYVAFFTKYRNCRSAKCRKINPF
jgi:site-specific DNA recombinase